MHSYSVRPPCDRDTPGRFLRPVTTCAVTINPINDTLLPKTLVSALVNSNFALVLLSINTGQLAGARAFESRGGGARAPLCFRGGRRDFASFSVGTHGAVFSFDFHPWPLTTRAAGYSQVAVMECCEFAHYGPGNGYGYPSGGYPGVSYPAGYNVHNSFYSHAPNYSPGLKSFQPPCSCRFSYFDFARGYFIRAASSRFIDLRTLTHFHHFYGRGFLPLFSPFHPLA